jgi:hypothetical protein
MLVKPYLQQYFCWLLYGELVKDFSNLKNKTMNVNLNETVTLSIETYEEMKAEIKNLRQQVEEKTIYKEVLPPVYGYVAMAVVIGLWFYMFHGLGM